MSNPVDMSKAYGTIPDVIESQEEIIPTATAIPVIEGQEEMTPIVTIVTTGNTTTFRRRGRSFCGCCCDMRRAVMIVNFLMIGRLLSKMKDNISEIKLNEINDIHQAISSIHLDETIIFMKILCFAIGISGALIFDANMVAIALIAYVISIVITFYTEFNLGSMLLNGFCAYPHVHLYHEIKRGIMTRENYHNERQSCCCT